MENWPRVDDNAEYLTLFNIERRETVELSESGAFLSYLFQQPIEWLIRKLTHLYGNDTHRRKKQLFYAFSNVVTVLAVLLLIIVGWSWFWIFDMLFGYKCLGIAYAFCFCYMFHRRYAL
jgi:hypothetical protein